jgi:ATP-dependent DNA helicase PIF1
LLTHPRFPTRKQVEDANSRRLAALNTEKKTYFAHDSGGRSDDGTPVTTQQATQMLEKLIAPDQLPLKVGAQVMLIKNLRQGVLVNGTLGRVLDFCTPGQARETRTEISDEPEDEVGFHSFRME